MIPTNGGTPILSSRNQNRVNNQKTLGSPLPLKRSDPLNSLSVAAAAAASTLRHSFNVTNNNYNLNHTVNPTATGLPDKLKGSFKGRGRHAAGLPKAQRSNGPATGNENYCNNHGRFQRTLSLDGGAQTKLILEKQAEQPPQMPQEVGKGAGSNGSGRNGKSKRMMFGGSKFSQNSLSFDMRDRELSSGAYLKKSHSAEQDSACEEDEDGVVLRKKQPVEFDENSDDSDRMSRTGSDMGEKQSGLLSTLISTSHRNSQLRSTLSKARHHLSFDKWRSSSSTNHHQQPCSNQCATPNCNPQNPQDCASANNNTNANCSANHSSNLSSSSSNTPPTPSESPGGRLSRWFSIRRGSSHHYDLNGSSSSGGGVGGRTGGSAGEGGRDVRDGGGGSGASSRLNSINNEHELAQQIQQQLHQSLSKVISQSNALQQLQQQSASVTSSSHTGNGKEKMPLVVEGNEDESYHTFGRGMSYRTTTSTLKSGGAMHASQLMNPMPSVPPAGLTQQQLKRRHIVAAIAHSEISYVATLGRLVNVSN